MTFMDAARGTSLFAGLDEAELETLGRVSRPHEMREGQVIFAEGAAGDGLYLIESGTVKIGKGPGHRPGTYARFLATLQPGDVFGDMTLVVDQPRSAAAVAASPCVLHGLTRADFEALLGSDRMLGTKVLRNLVTMLCKRLQRAGDAIVGVEERSGSVGPADLAMIHSRILRGGD